MNKLTTQIKQVLTGRSFWSVVGAIAIMVVIAVAYFYPDDMQGNVLQQHDTRQGLAIGQEAQAFTAATGEETRWTNSLFGGMPTFQISPSYPSNSLFTWIKSVLTLGLPMPANLLFIMMLGFFILLMVMRMRWYVALIGAIAYGFSTYFIIIIGAGHLWKFITLAYIPPTIAGIILCYRGRYLAGAALTALFGMLQIESNHVQMTYYFLFVVLGLVIAYFVIALREKALRRWCIATAVALGAGLLAVAANLPSLYNTYEYSKETMRGGHSELTKPGADAVKSDGLDKNYIWQFSYGGSETMTLLIPNVKGGADILPQQGENQYLSLDKLDKVEKMINDGDLSPETAYCLQMLPQYFGEPEHTNGPVYVGALIVVFFLIGCFLVKGPVKWALLVLTIFSILLALGRNCVWINDLMVDCVPLYSKFRTPESILVIAEFTMPLLAAMALQVLVMMPRKEVWERTKTVVCACFGVAAFLCLIGILAPGIYGEAFREVDTMTLERYGVPQQFIPDIALAAQQLRHSMVVADSLRSLLFIVAGFMFLMLYMKQKISLLVGIGGIGLLVLGDLYFVNRRYVNHDSFLPAPISTDEVFVKSKADEFILQDTAMNYRVWNIPQFMEADPSYYHKAIGGYHAAKLQRYQDVIEYFFGSEHDYTNVLAMLNAKYVIQNPNEMPMLNPMAMGNAWLVDAVDYVDNADAEIAAVEVIDLPSHAVADKRFAEVLGQSQPKSVGDTIFETSYAPNRLTYHVNTARGGVAVFSEVYFPWGWHATIDGKPAEIGRVNYILRAVNVPAGSHTIEMWFDPESLHNTSTAAYIAIAIVYLLLIGAVAWPIYVNLRKRKSVSKDDAASSK